MTAVGWIAIGAAGIGAWWLFGGSGGSGGNEAGSLSNTRQTTTRPGKPGPNYVWQNGTWQKLDTTKSSYVAANGDVTYTEAHQIDTAAVPPPNYGGGSKVIIPNYSDLLSRAGQMGIPQGAFSAPDPSTYSYWKRTQVDGLWTNVKTPLTPEMVDLVNKLKSLGFTSTTIGNL